MGANIYKLKGEGRALTWTYLDKTSPHPVSCSAVNIFYSYDSELEKETLPRPFPRSKMFYSRPVLYWPGELMFSQWASWKD